MADYALSLDDIHRLIGQLTLENTLLRKLVAAKADDIGTSDGDNRISRKVISDTKSNSMLDDALPASAVSKGNGRDNEHV